MRHISKYCIFIFSFLASACIIQDFYAADITAFTFNVQNLFDGVEIGTEYTDYQEERWGEQQYQKRLKAIGQALQSLRPRPDILALQEVENETVVRELQRYYLPRLRHIAISKEGGTALQVAVLSSFVIEKQNIHNLFNAEYFRVRPILEVELIVPNLSSKLLQVLVLHFKSRIPTKHEIYTSEWIRNLQFRLLQASINPQIPSLILGDFNEEHAFDILHLEHAENTNQVQLANPLQYYLQASPQGTYFYDSQWVRLDHIIFDRIFLDSFTDLSLREIRQEPFIVIQDGTEKPNAFYRYRNNFAAVSDHIPLMVQASY